MPRFPVDTLLGPQFRLRLVRLGKTFSGGFQILNLTAGASTFVEVRAPASKFITAIARFMDASQGNLLVDLIEAPTITTPGVTQLATLNMNRNSTETASLTVFSDPAGVSGGTSIETSFIPPGAGQGQQKGGLVTQAAVERVLKLNTTYAFKITNLGQGTHDRLHVAFLWYESGLSEFQAT